mmetsp:Transcript_69069/g.174097  ORF Transcript_69069/g.174097 Transcript_69069/m.174097 type:complete len:245 (-) Transcript_69069:578-1312(-)
MLRKERTRENLWQRTRCFAKNASTSVNARGPRCGAATPSATGRGSCSTGRLFLPLCCWASDGSGRPGVRCRRPPLPGVPSRPRPLPPPLALLLPRRSVEAAADAASAGEAAVVPATGAEAAPTPRMEAYSASDRCSISAKPGADAGTVLSPPSRTSVDAVLLAMEAPAPLLPPAARIKRRGSSKPRQPRRSGGTGPAAASAGPVLLLACASLAPHEGGATAAVASLTASAAAGVGANGLEAIGA